MWNGVDFIANTVNGFTFARRVKNGKFLRLILILNFRVDNFIFKKCDTFSFLRGLRIFFGNPQIGVVLSSNLSKGRIQTPLEIEISMRKKILTSPSPKPFEPPLKKILASKIQVPNGHHL